MPMVSALGKIMAQEYQMLCDQEKDEVLKYKGPVSYGHFSTDVGVTCALVVFVTLVSICLLQIGRPLHHSVCYHHTEKCSIQHI